jgi:AraC-like DNA-binding protein
MSSDREVTITLTNAQIERVTRDAAGGEGLAPLLAPLNDPRALERALRPLMEDPSYARSTLRALLILGSFPVDGSALELTDVASKLGFSPSTTHRYLKTWMAVGLLEQDPVSRRYCRPTPARRRGPRGH